MRYVDVAVAAGSAQPRRAGAGVPGVYSYHLEGGLKAEPGWLVEVPFGPRLLAGIVVERLEREPGFSTRPVARLLGEQPVLSGRAIELARFVSRTYRTTLFECLSLLLPPGFSQRLPQAQRDGAWTPPRFRTARPEPGPPGRPGVGPAALTAPQAAACQAIIQAARTGFRPFLLYGVTGSGKTLVYLEALAEVVAAGGQAILLVSEIALTPELLERVERRFPGQVAVLHSQLSPAQRYFNWLAAEQGQAQVVLGSRSAIFAPTPSLGLIVLDEEHEWTYKQESPPRYHAREVALELGRLAGVPVVLSSATPDVATAWRARSGEFVQLTLPRRFQAASSNGQGPGRALPPVEIVDLRQELLAGNHAIFSRSLQAELRGVLERREQAILFINRRGTATCVSCRHCGYVARCRRCEIPLVYHRAGDQLVCHRCSRRRPRLTRCPNCGGGAIRHFGVGTQRVESDVAGLFPEARLARLDRDSGRAERGQAPLFERFRRQEIDVLVGTQVVAKALDFPLVTLVGVVLADVGLYLPDFRAPERSFQLLTQVAGRAGRGERPGRVVIQTYAPEHYAIRLAAQHDYEGFYQREIRFRREHGYPPFARLARLVFSASDERRCWRETHALRRALLARLEALGDAETRVIGPAPCYAQRLRGRYRWQIVLCGQRLEPLLEQSVLPLGWSLDVDPVSLL
jgi:primosomal protein N' (replication factor Y)